MCGSLAGVHRTAARKQAFMPPYQGHLRPPRGELSALGNGQASFADQVESPLCCFLTLLSWVDPECRAKIAMILAGPELMWLERCTAYLPESLKPPAGCVAPESEPEGEGREVRSQEAK